MGSCASVQNHERTPFYARFILQEKIGQGSYGKVYLVKDKRNQKILAVKVQAAQFGREWVITDEVNIWRSLGRHPNIVSFHDLRQEANVYFILMEVCPRALSDRVMYSPQWTAVDLMHDFKQALLGLSHMHARRILHRDIKVQNFLYGGRDDRTLKLADFGLSVHLRPGEKLDAVCGSPAFMAPEMVMRQGYEFKIDMWSMGVTFFMVMYGTLLVGKPKMSVPEMKEAIKSPTATKTALQGAMQKADTCEGEERELKHAALDVVKQLTVREPTQRVGPKDALDLPFIHLVAVASEEDLARYRKILLVDRPPAAKKKAVTEPEADMVRSGKPPVPRKPQPQSPRVDALTPVVPGGGSGGNPPFTTSGDRQLGVNVSDSGQGKRRAKSSNVIMFQGSDGVAKRPSDRIQLPDHLDSPSPNSFRGMEGGASSLKLQRFKSAGNLEGGRRQSQHSKVSCELGLAGESEEFIRMSVTNCLMQAYRGGSRRLIDSGFVRVQGSGVLSPDSSYALGGGGLESFGAPPSDEAHFRSRLAAPSNRSAASSSGAAMSVSQLHAAVGDSRGVPVPKSRADHSSPFFVSEEPGVLKMLPGSIQERLDA
ncbi:CCRP1 [Symbiodinium sp. CCMP2456]|nr:CCRP1 [Symbiodinium sp. CCMP2456]